jgi:hypothetical protein
MSEEALAILIEAYGMLHFVDKTVSECDEMQSYKVYDQLRLNITPDINDWQKRAEKIILSKLRASHERKI